MSASRLCLSLLRALALAVACLAAGGAAAADFVSSPADLAAALDALKTAIGPRPRALSIVIEPAEVAIEAQDPGDPRHVNLWRQVARQIGPFGYTRTLGREAVGLNLVDPDLDANLFDLSGVDLSAAGRLVAESIKRAGLQDAAAVTRMEIKRQVHILPRPAAGDIRWDVLVVSERERATITADAAGRILGADLSHTRRAQTVDIFLEPGLVAEAAAAFRERVTHEAVLSQVSIRRQSIGYSTILPDKAMSDVMRMSAVQVFGWTLGGLASAFGAIRPPDNSAPSPFAVDEVDWTIVASLEAEALKQVDAPGARIDEIIVEKSQDALDASAPTWRVDIRDDLYGTTRVTADAKGAILDVEDPKGRWPKPRWLEPATLTATIARFGERFGADARFASMKFDEDSSVVNVETPGKDEVATYKFDGHRFKRAGIAYPNETIGPRLAPAEASELNEALLARLEADALARRVGNRRAYLQSVSVGARLFALDVGAKAIEIGIRDSEVKSALSQYRSIIYGFDGRLIYTSPE